MINRTGAPVDHPPGCPCHWRVIDPSLPDDEPIACRECIRSDIKSTCGHVTETPATQPSWPQPPFWSDDFDMDLLKLFPDLPDRLGAMRHVSLWTHGRTSHGRRLNHPAVWPARDGLGMVAFFGLSPDSTGRPDGYWAPTAELVECTWLEVLRDAWPHTYAVLVDGRRLWDTGRLYMSHFSKLMFDLRGWKKLPDGHADRLRGEVLASVLAATEALRRMIPGGGS